MTVKKLADVPRKVREIYERGVAAMERGNLDYAIDTFLDLLDREPMVLEVRKVLRAAEIRKFRDAKGGTMTHIITSLTGFPSVLITKGTMGKNPLKAMHSAEKLLRRDPLNIMFLNLLAEAAMHADIPEVATQALETARDDRPDDVTLLKRLGALYTEVERNHDARLVYERLMKLRPNDQELIKAYKDATALDSMQKGGWSEAGSFRDVIRDTEEAARLEQEGKAVKTTKDVIDLIVDAEAKYKNEPENVNYVRALADLYARAERFIEAADTMERFQKASSTRDPQIDRAISDTRLQQFDFEVTQLEAAGDTEAAEAKKKERHDFRLEDAKDRVTRYPNDLQFRFDLGEFLFEEGEHNEAIQQFQLAQKNPQRHVQSLYYLGLCFKAKEQYDIAMEQLTAANNSLQTMDNTKKDVVYELGLLHESMGNVEEAKNHFKQIYSVDIGYKDVAQRIEQAYGT